MNHQEEHQHHRKEREVKNEAKKEHERSEERKSGSLHPGWYWALGVVLTLIATLVWTFFFYPGIFTSS